MYCFGFLLILINFILNEMMMFSHHMMTNLAISDTSNRRDVSFDAKFALRHKLSLSE